MVFNTPNFENMESYIIIQAQKKWGIVNVGVLRMYLEVGLGHLTATLQPD